MSYWHELYSTIDSSYYCYASRITKKVIMAWRGPTVDRNFLWGIFTKIDKDGNGRITAHELQQALSNGSWTPFNPETVRLMISMFDRDNSGTIEFNEFYALWQYVTDWQKTFRSYDTDNSGSIDKNELKMALTNFGKYTFKCLCVLKFIVKYVLTNSFKGRDHNLNGWITIGYEDFLSMVFSVNLGT
ncbi:Programmed cell death protein 6 [Acropora cervicornis]|uniref:Programmed cell death protein 6 n=1 Tax=Acropora cervicornis TaxID=6130 RepID=A0AAD9UX05_ACRCE|nr:Programmed cell death protein 6 [Acropora cervicornis]